MAASLAACMALATAFNHLPPKALPFWPPSTAWICGSVHVDYGVMQINSLWVPALAKSTGWTETAVRVHLMYDPCFNIAAAGAILRQDLNETHGDLRRALAYYHSHKPSLNQTYRTRETMAGVRMFTRPLPDLPPLPQAAE
jgi:hypothetical protein